MAETDVLTSPGTTVVALDFDGTLAPIVGDPSQAYVHPRSLEAMARLGPHLASLAIITGRPVQQAIELGGFDRVPGLEALQIYGQYGAEHWDARTGRVTRPQRPSSVAVLAEILPAWLAERGASRVRVEDKGLAVALHTRGLDPYLLSRLRLPLDDLGERLGLAVEPGRQVIELRAAGTDKGIALRRIIADAEPDLVVYAGDDLGDLPAFQAVADLRTSGRAEGLLVCSASTEQDALVELSDLVLDGPPAVADWLKALADSIS